MTTARMVGVLAGLAIVGIAVVVIRVDQSRMSTHIQALESEETELKREIGRQEMRIAQLRSPQAIREQAGKLGLEVGPTEPQTVKKAAQVQRRSAD